MNQKHSHRLFAAITATAWAMLLAGVCYGNLSAQPVRTTQVITPTTWSDPVQTVHEYPVGPYDLTAWAFPWQHESWRSVRTDRVGPLVSQLTAHWTPFTNLLSHTLYTDPAAYRRAWWLGTRFDTWGPACYCWQATQGGVHETLGLSTWGGAWGADPGLLDDALRWDDAIGRHLDWQDTWIITDVARELEWITGAPTGEPPRVLPPFNPPFNPPFDPPFDPSVDVPEPETLPLMALGMALGALAWRGRQS